MKIFKCLFAFVLMGLFATSMMAQDHPHHRHHGHSDHDQHHTAKTYKIEDFKTDLNLTEAQLKSIAEIRERYEQKHQAMLVANKEGSSVMEEKEEQLTKEMNKAIHKVLTHDQLKKLHEKLMQLHHGG